MPRATKSSARACLRTLTPVIVLLAIGFGCTLVLFAQSSPLQVISPYFKVSTMTLPNGDQVERDIIGGPPVPPAGTEALRPTAIVPLPATATVLTAPHFKWVFGCSAVSAAMIAGYYDRNGYANMYTGSTNGGVMPLDDSSWPTWTDAVGASYPSCPLIASRNGTDGRVANGSIDDYWYSYNSGVQDPYITNGWTQHTWGDAVGDYMWTSQSAYGNNDGSTTFWNYTSYAGQLTCDYMVANKLTADGTVGRRAFYQAKGYTVTSCYNQKTDNTVSGGFSFASFKTEIDAGRPVFLNLQGHSIVGVGYDAATNTVYLHDTWDWQTHTMTWGTSYSGMQLLSVSVVTLASSSPPPSPGPQPTFTDPTLTAGTTAIKAVHITELRSAINTLRTAYGLATYTWTDSTLTTGSTSVKAAHITEMRTALNAVYDARSMTRPTYTDSTITAGSTAVKTTHISELRSAVLAVW